MTAWLRSSGEDVSIAVLATPRASRTELAGVADGRLRIRVAAPPVAGAANEELVRFVARTLGLARSAVTVTVGAAGRRKTLVARGIAASDVRRRLAV